jgi:arsenate reductase
MKQKTILFLCTHNACRSQMAEGIINTFYRSNYQAFSAGIQKTNVNPYAIEVMKEIGVDLSKQYSKDITEFKGMTLDYVVTVCDNAKEACPFFPGKNIVHKSFEDPAEFEGTIEETLAVFRKVRDEIRTWITSFFK